MGTQQFEDFELEEVEESKGRTVSESEVYRFAGIAGIYGETHTNKAFMEQTEFGRRIAQGILSLTHIYGLFANSGWNPDVVALYGLDNVRFVNPVFLDDTVHLRSEVIDKERIDEDRGNVTFEHRLRKEDGTLAVICEWTTQVHARGREQ